MHCPFWCPAPAHTLHRALEYPSSHCTACPDATPLLQYTPGGPLHCTTDLGTMSHNKFPSHRVPHCSPSLSVLWAVACTYPLGQGRRSWREGESGDPGCFWTALTYHITVVLSQGAMAFQNLSGIPRHRSHNCHQRIWLELPPCLIQSQTEKDCRHE